MNAQENKVTDTIEEKKDELISLVREIVRIPSTVGNEGEAQNWLAKKYHDIGLDVVSFEPELDKVSCHPSFIESGFMSKGRPNIIGILEGDKSFNSLTLNGHIDVVSPEPYDSWSYNPWQGVINNGRIYGRGAADMKGGLIANYFAIKTLLDLGMRPKGTVMLQSVVEEEAGGGLGTLACLLEGYRTNGFVASEPHQLRITVSHAGILYFRIKVKGKTAHGGEAHQGVNAIGKMLKIYNKLIELDEVRGSKTKFDLFEMGSGRATHLNVGTMVAGDWPSTVAGFATMECRISFIPGESQKQIKKMVEETVQEVAHNDVWLQEHLPEVQWFGWHADPWYQDPKSEYVHNLRRNAKKILNFEPQIIGRASGNDARFTQYFKEMSGVCFGPIGANIHGIDEYVTIDSLVQNTQILALHILDWCENK